MEFISSDNVEKIISMLKNEVTKYIEKSGMEIQKSNTNNSYDIDRTIKKFLTKKYPFYLFLHGKSGKYNINPTIPTWVMSPIESTLKSAHKFKHKAISLALVYENDPLLGIVYIPSTKELYYAQKDKGAFLNGVPIKVSSESPDRLPNTILDTNPTSSAAIHICKIAAGKSEMYLRDKIRPWDIAAAKCILEEAGGRITTTRNDIITYYHKTDILATNGLLHTTLLHLMV